MQKLREPILMTPQLQKSLEENKNKLLFSSVMKTFLYITDYTIEDVVTVHKHRKWWGALDTTTANETYLTEVDVRGWNIKEKKWKGLTDTGFSLVMYYENIQGMRTYYSQNIKPALESLGVRFGNRQVNE